MEEEYLSKASALDDSQLERLLAAHWDDIRNYIFVTVRRQDCVDDLAQETFIRAFRSLHAFRGEASFKTWLLTIARNVTRSYQRSAWIRRVVLMERVWPEGSRPSAETEYLLTSSAEQIWAKVLDLPAKLREVLVLDAKYDLPMKEIAIILGISEGTVKSRLNRARSKMADWLEGGFVDGFEKT